MTSPLLEISADELREHIGEYIDTVRERTPLERKAFDATYGRGTEGGGGMLTYVKEAVAHWEHDGEVEDFGVVPWIYVDWGYCWAILPGTTVSFRSTTPADVGP